MTKTQIFEAVMAVCMEYKVPEKFKAELETLLAPKNSGRSVNIDEVTKKDKEGKITEIMCSISGVFLPATAEYFYEARDGKGINGLTRISKQADAIRKAHLKALVASSKAITDDVLDGKITPAEGKKQLEKIKAQTPDYSKVGKVAKEAK